MSNPNVHSALASLQSADESSREEAIFLIGDHIQVDGIDKDDDKSVFLALWQCIATENRPPLIEEILRSLNRLLFYHERPPVEVDVTLLENNLTRLDASSLHHALPLLYAMKGNASRTVISEYLGYPLESLRQLAADIIATMED